MIDPHTSLSIFTHQVNEKKQNEYIVVHLPSGLTGKTLTKKLASRISEINQFVKAILSEKSKFSPEELHSLKKTYTKVIKENTPWYHKILAFFNKSYRSEQNQTKALLSELSQALAVADKQQTDSAKQFIHIQVKQHLQPYFEGLITAETDDKSRKPLIERLEPAIRKQFPLSSIERERIEGVAFNEYIEQSLKDYTKKVGHVIHPQAPEWQEHRRAFGDAFKEAIKIDFTPSFRHSLDLSMVLFDKMWKEFRRASLHQK